MKDYLPENSIQLTLNNCVRDCFVEIIDKLEDILRKLRDDDYTKEDVAEFLELVIDEM